MWSARLLGSTLVCAAIIAACAAPRQPPPAPGEPSAPASTTRGTAGQSATESATAGESATEPAEGDAWVWEEDAAEADAHDDIAAEAGEPVGEDELGEVGAELVPEEVSGDPEAESGWVDPCTLVEDAEWGEWTGQGLGTPRQPLEDGDACGWISRDDDLRMAIGVFTALGAERWLTAEEASRGEPVADVGDRALWLENWPVEQSSTLVVEVGDVDVVVEMSARDAEDDRLRNGALHFAELALGRLP